MATLSKDSTPEQRLSAHKSKMAMKALRRKQWHEFRNSPGCRVLAKIKLSRERTELREIINTEPF